MEGLYYKLDSNKNPVAGTREEAIELFNNPEGQMVSRTELEGVLICTVFLIIDHSVLPGTLPLLFETMIFGGPLHHTAVRYYTYQQAQQGHDKMVMETLLRTELVLN